MTGVSLRLYYKWTSAPIIQQRGGTSFLLQSSEHTREPPLPFCLVLMRQYGECVAWAPWAPWRRTNIRILITHRRRQRPGSWVISSGSHSELKMREWHPLQMLVRAETGVNQRDCGMKERTGQDQETPGLLYIRLSTVWRNLYGVFSWAGTSAR